MSRRQGQRAAPGTVSGSANALVRFAKEYEELKEEVLKLRVVIAKVRKVVVELESANG